MQFQGEPLDHEYSRAGWANTHHRHRHAIRQPAFMHCQFFQWLLPIATSDKAGPGADPATTNAPPQLNPQLARCAVPPGASSPVPLHTTLPTERRLIGHHRATRTRLEKSRHASRRARGSSATSLIGLQPLKLPFPSQRPRAQASQPLPLTGPASFNQSINQSIVPP